MKNNAVVCSRGIENRMSDWSTGYVTDIPYTYGVYNELSPTLLGFAALVAGVTAPDPEGALTCCELGCGQGYSANVVAAANPNIEVYANDFNPAHIVGARALATAAGTRNVHFHDSSFAEFAADETLPEFDIITLHGVYSWISAENRRYIVDFIRKRLKVGGLVYVSYNAAPAYAAVTPLRRLLVDRAEGAHGSTATRIGQAVAYVQQLVDAKSIHFTGNGISEYFKQIKDGGLDYVAHEYFNRDWTAFYHSDVAADLAEAKLSYVGPADLLNAVDAVNLTAEQRALLATAATTTERETLRDYIVNQAFRRDIFVKGAVPLTPHEARKRWLKTRFVLTTGRADVRMAVKGVMGEAELQAEVYTPLLDALANGAARTVAQLVADPNIAALGWGRLQQALTVLVGSAQLQPGLDEAGDAARLAGTKAFNRAVIERARSSDQWCFLTSPITAGGVFLRRTSQLFLLARENGAADPPAFVCEALLDQGFGTPGGILAAREEALADLRALFHIFNEKQVPLLQSLGVLCLSISAASSSAAA
jgi:2-polyprenyl-3-methyl-5-hydroxy-6-metoxy-1,4-benzoquinol methylase